MAAMHFLIVTASPAFLSQTALLLSEAVHSLIATASPAFPSQTALLLSEAMHLNAATALPAFPSQTALLLSAATHLVFIPPMRRIRICAMIKSQILSSTVKKVPQRKTMQKNTGSHLTDPARPTSPMPW